MTSGAGDDYHDDLGAADLGDEADLGVADLDGGGHSVPARPPCIRRRRALHPPAHDEYCWGTGTVGQADHSDGCWSCDCVCWWHHHRLAVATPVVVVAVGVENARVATDKRPPVRL